MSGYLNPHAPGCYWYNAAQKFGAPNIKWCEETLCHVISEPANTWSNLFYLIAAFIIYKMTRKLESKSLRYMPYALFILGAGSFYFHMSNFYISQVADFIGMFFFVHWPIFLNLMRAKIYRFKSAKLSYALFLLLNTLTVHIFYINKLNYQFLIVLAVVLILITEFIATKNEQQKAKRKYLILSLSFIAIAESFSLLDLSRTWCNPQNHFVQGHAIWHVLSSIGLFFVFLYYKQFDKKLP